MILAFDLGQTRLKVALFDLGGRLLGRETARNTDHAAGAWRWQDPRDWWEDVGRLTRALRAQPGLSDRPVRGVGVSGRGAAFVPIDADGALLTECWSDSRHQAQADKLAAWIAQDERRTRYGASLARLLWMREAMPQAAERVVRLLAAKDWLVYRMTGRAVTDPASGPDGLEYDRGAVTDLGIDPGLLPDVAVPWSVAGPLLPRAAQHLGLPAGIPVAVGGHDGACANVGAGAGAPGGYAITLGTHAVVRAVVSGTPAGARRFYALPPGGEVVGGNALQGGRAADWFLDTWLGSPPEEERAAVFARMDAAAAEVAPGADGLRFLPFFHGQVAPEVRPGATATFTGMRIDQRPAQMYRAVLEGVAFAIKSIWDQVRGWCGDPVVARFTGSGARSHLWPRIVVDAIDWPVELTDGVAEARGAAIYAAVAAGFYPDADSAADAMVHPGASIEPDRRRVAEYDEIYASWRQASETMRELEQT